jgi:hypothetical protein
LLYPQTETTGEPGKKKTPLKKVVPPSVGCAFCSKTYAKGSSSLSRHVVLTHFRSVLLPQMV